MAGFITLGKEPPMRIRIHLLGAAAILLLACAGCGSSGGDAPTGGGGATPPPAGGSSLGSRSVPGGTIAVAAAGAVQPGADNVFRITLGGGMPAPGEVRAWIGVGYDPAIAGIVATPVAGAPGAYDVALAVPAPLAAGVHVWVRLTFSDGSLIETGSEDFPLAGH